MNKLTIPTILVATVMVAGAFAFMPVEQATTVHTTIQGTQLIDRTDSASATVAATDFTFTCDRGCVIQGIHIDDDDDGTATQNVVVESYSVTNMVGAEALLFDFTDVIVDDDDTGDPEGIIDSTGALPLTLAAGNSMVIAIAGTSPLYNIIITGVAESGGTFSVT